MTGKSDNPSIKHYSSFKEVAVEARNHKSRVKTDDEIKSQQEKFKKRNHIGTCRCCKSELTYIGGSIFVCQNPECKGFPFKYKDSDGVERTGYRPSYQLLRSDIAVSIAEKIF